MIKAILRFDWALWFFWIMASAWGWLLAILIFPELRLVAAGVFVGVFQWLVLQGRISRPWRWILATGSGWLLGYFATLYPVPGTLTGMTLGLTTGIAQWIVLRRELRWAGWWIVFSIMGWVTGLNMMPGFFVTGVMAGAITGLCLEILLRNPKPRTTSA